jgi:hypothetical protein
LVIIKPDVEVHRDLKLFDRSEVITLRHLLDLTVEAFDQAVCLRRLRRGQAVLNVQVFTRLVELALARRSALAQAEEAIGELLYVVRENSADADRAGTL